MEIAGCVVKRGKMATKQGFTAAAALWFLLSNSGANVCAQSMAREDRVIAPALRPAVSESETSATRQNPPAIFIAKIIGTTDASEVASNRRIIVDPAMTQGDSIFVQPVRPASFADQANGALEKVTATKAEKPLVTHTSNTVTLWDEIAPPVPAPVPVDAAARSTPGDVANSGARRTQ
jgi:hypothetical protein